MAHAAAYLLGAEHHHADGATGALWQAGDQFGSRHGDGNAGTIINGARAQIPAVQVTADQDDFFRSLSTDDVENDIAAHHFTPPASGRADGEIDVFAQLVQPADMIRVRVGNSNDRNLGPLAIAVG